MAGDGLSACVDPVVHEQNVVGGRNDGAADGEFEVPIEVVRAGRLRQPFVVVGCPLRGLPDFDHAHIQSLGYEARYGGSP